MTPDVHWIDAILALTVLEGLGLWWWHRRTARGVAPADFAWNWASGLCLMAAVRLALGGAALHWILACLSAAGAIHVLDLRRRWR